MREIEEDRTLVRFNLYICFGNSELSGANARGPLGHSEENVGSDDWISEVSLKTVKEIKNGPAGMAQRLSIDQ